ncbi:ribonuclease D [Ancylothrix sp. C2]|uniref:ribonuclease D n=1 Tax=Ancylothrix sp. D3o TaxID=2953691 RepID=UPI0021BAB4A3|nr:ribonuclease D [Ancylothrix sp. D3o]MCT7952392.1 ribonuclease D [Ancylothrix sp. D3o]
MPYLTDADDMRNVIAKVSQFQILWIDTEVADYKSKKPRLSLIQVLADPRDLTGQQTYVFDVLDKPQITELFIDEIMADEEIEKVFHNASYDLRFLGKTTAKNVTCTLEMAKKLPYYLLPVPNLSLKTLASQICKFSEVDKEEQGSNWGKRPLTEKQLEYAHKDPVYLAHVYRVLLHLLNKNNPDPATENLNILAKRYQEIEHYWKLLDSEMTALQERIKKAMQAQSLSETTEFKLSVSERKTLKTGFAKLAELAQSRGLELDFSITLTKVLQEVLGDAMDELAVDVEKTTVCRLTTKFSDNEESNE